MSAILIKLGIGVATAALAFIFMEWHLNISRGDSRKVNSESSTYDGRNQNLCCICLQKFKETSCKLATLSCNHKFHKDCIKNVFSNESNKSCPLCRKRISNLEIQQLSTLPNVEALEPSEEHRLP